MMTVAFAVPVYVCAFLVSCAIADAELSAEEVTGSYRGCPVTKPSERVRIFPTVLLEAKLGEPFKQTVRLSDI